MFRVDFPRMVSIRQRFDAPRVDDVPAKVAGELERIGLASTVKPGMRVALTAGSRGVTNIASIIRTMAAELRRLGAEPFVIPTMGSHGGATPEGQVQVLQNIGVTEETVGAPIRSSLETVQIATTPSGVPVYVDKMAAESDGVVVVARIKPHTDFEGDVQSGLFKMMVIGLGKHRGAITAHRQFITRGYCEMVKEIGRSVLANLPIIAGVATIENVYDETADIVAVRPEDFEAVELQYLQKARDLVGMLPFDDIDVLVVDEIGKDVSGTGMDTKVIGRIYNLVSKSPAKPRIKRIVVRDLTHETAGSAVGIGMADFITRRSYEKISLPTTYVNCLTAQAPEIGRIPMICENDREALTYALATIGEVEGPNARVVHIKNTLRVGRMLISEALMPEARQKDFLDIVGGPEPVVFDAEGNLPGMTA